MYFCYIKNISNAYLCLLEQGRRTSVRTSLGESSSARHACHRIRLHGAAVAQPMLQPRLGLPVFNENVEEQARRRAHIRVAHIVSDVFLV